MAIHLDDLSVQEEVAAVYIGYYDRAGDPFGFGFWTQTAYPSMFATVQNEPEFSGATLAEQEEEVLARIAQDFSTQPESRSEYPFFTAPSEATAQAFLTQVYQNLFNRNPDSEGSNFWTPLLLDAVNNPNTAAFSVGEIILEVIKGAQEPDRTTFLNKIEVALEWTSNAADNGIGTSATNFVLNDKGTGQFEIVDQEAYESARSVLDGDGETRENDDEVPVIGFLPGTVSYDENRSETDVLVDVFASDNVGVTGFTFISGNDDNWFEINTNGEVTFTNDGIASEANDFETGSNSFALSVAALDAAGNTSEAASIDFSVLDVNEISVEGANVVNLGESVADNNVPDARSNSLGSFTFVTFDTLSLLYDIDINLLKSFYISGDSIILNPITLNPYVGLSRAADVKLISFSGISAALVDEEPVRTVKTIAKENIEIALIVEDSVPPIPNGLFDQLESVHIVSKTGDADFRTQTQVSFDGGDSDEFKAIGNNFARSLKSIYVESGEDAQAEVSLTANSDDIPGTIAQNYMQSLETIELVGGARGASLSVEDEGSGGTFLANLQSITLSTRNQERSDIQNVELSLSASANEASSDGDRFMRSLETIVVTSNVHDASVSISSEGGANFLESLRSIEVRAAAESEISLSTSAGGNFEASDFYMKSLETITVVNTFGDDRASMSISVEGGLDFFASLRSIEVENNIDLDIISLSQYSGDAEVEIMAAAVGNTDGSTPFMESLKELSAIGVESGAVIDIVSNRSGDILPNLESFDLQGNLGENLVVLGNLGTSDTFLPNLETIELSGLEDFYPNVVSQVNENYLEFLSTSSFFDFFSANLPPVSLSGADVVVFNFLPDTTGTDQAGRNVLQSLEAIEIESGISANVLLINGTEIDGHRDENFETFPAYVARGGLDFVPSLERIDLTSGFDGDVILNTTENSAFEVLEKINVRAATRTDFPEYFDELLRILDENGRYSNDEESSIVADVTTSLIAIDGRDTANSFAALAEIVVDASSSFTTELPANVHDVDVQLMNFAEGDFEVELTNNGENLIDFFAEDTPGLSRLAITHDGEVTYTLVGNQAGLSEIDLTGVSFDGGIATGNLSGVVVVGDDLLISIGAGALDHTGGDFTETFAFTDKSIGDIFFTDFNLDAPNTVANGDLINFSALGVSDITELTFTNNAGDLEIASVGGTDFTGTVVLVGHGGAFDADNTIVNDNFIF